MKAGDVGAGCVLWQKRLRLQDWDVTVAITAPDEDNPGKQGSITWRVHQKEARISLIDPADKAAQDRGYDLECTLVHELLHLHFIAWDTEDGTPEDTALEQAITTLSRALVMAYQR